MPVRMGSLCVHERTSQYGGRRADRNTACPCCGAEVESLSHLMFDCSAASAQRDSMFYAIKSVSGCCAEKLRTVMSMSYSSIRLLHFVSDNVWGSADRQFAFFFSVCVQAYC
jgi:hypothetical protein